MAVPGPSHLAVTEITSIMRSRVGQIAPMETLPDEVILHILQLLVDNPSDLVAVCLTSKRLNSLCMYDTWQRVCYAKWHKPFVHAHPGNYHRLFATSNGLLGTDIHLELMHLPITLDYSSMAMHKDLSTNLLQVAIDGEGIVGICTISTANTSSIPAVTSTLPDGNSRKQQEAATSKASTQDKQTNNTPSTAQQGLSGTTAGSALYKGLQPETYQHVVLPPKQTATALAWCQGGHHLLVGSMSGHVHVIQRKEQQEDGCRSLSNGGQCSNKHQPIMGTEPSGVEPSYHYQLQYTMQPYSNLAVSQIASLEPQQTWANMGANNNDSESQQSSTGWPVAVLHDQYLGCSGPLAADQHNLVNIYDPGTEQYIRSATIQDMFHPWEFVCMKPLSPNELVLGSIAEPCSNCSWSEWAWCCPHRLQTRNAMLWMMDLRVADPLVSRYSLLRTTLYPQLATMRQHFVATSHAHKPLQIWDLRQMSMPVYEVNRLDFAYNWGPLGGSTRWCDLWELHLTCCDDMLVGRSENGAIWLWDLADCLGWESGSGPAGARNDDEPQPVGTRSWPQQLGSAPCRESPWGIEVVPGVDYPSIVCLTQGAAWHPERVAYRHSQCTTVEGCTAEVPSLDGLADGASGSGIVNETAVPQDDVCEDSMAGAGSLDVGEDISGGYSDEERTSYGVEQGQSEDEDYEGYRQPEGNNVHSTDLNLNTGRKPYYIYRRHWVVDNTANRTEATEPKPSNTGQLYDWKNVPTLPDVSTDVRRMNTYEWSLSYNTLACISLHG